MEPSGEKVAAEGTKPRPEGVKTRLGVYGVAFPVEVFIVTHDHLLLATLAATRPPVGVQTGQPY
jgi:hypothetical protein